MLNLFLLLLTPLILFVPFDSTLAQIPSVAHTDQEPSSLKTRTTADEDHNFLVPYSADEETPASSLQDSLIGTWVLKSFQCEDGTAVPDDQPQNPFASLTEPPTKTFAHNNKFEDSVLIPLGRDVTCKTIGNGFYIVDEGILVIFLDELTSPDCPGLVQSFNASLEDNNLFEYEITMPKKNQFVLLQPLKQGETDFRCGQDKRVAEVWEKTSL
ncbi:MAG: hypothetical protein M9899_01745 [Bdellovibrionaceae bacterium]|nr:hypothetical protein [Pseudobdellovibrionaceae bacterium]